MGSFIVGVIEGITAESAEPTEIYQKRNFSAFSASSAVI
jgi:hypothetical protein